MCTILFSWKNTPGYKLVLAANRDEFYERNTKTAHWWDDAPDVLGGRDLQAGGTWMGINKKGRFAAVTNFRKLPLDGPFETSRGDLVKDFITDTVDPLEYLAFLESNGEKFEGFNLIFGDTQQLHYFSNKSVGKILEPKVYGLSNHLLDTPWQKVEKGKENFKLIVGNGGVDKERLFELLKDEEKSPDHLLPDTGLDLERERLVSSIFIQSDNYGTRLSTVLTISENNEVEFHERSFIPQGNGSYRFKIK